MTRAKRLSGAGVRMASAALVLSELRDEYQDWYDALPEPFIGGPTGERLEEAIDKLEEWIDLIEDIRAEAAELELPKGYGRD